MSKNKKILILNTGGTFNKIYNEIEGKLTVANNNDAVLKILRDSKIENIKVKGLLFKDSLDINFADRKYLKNMIEKSSYKNIIIIHGTDTMNETAQFLSEKIKNKKIVLTGSMVPFSIDSLEATANFLLSLGFLQNKTKNAVYIAMHGLVKIHTNIVKNRNIGKFECL